MAGRVLWSGNTFEGNSVILPVAGFKKDTYLVIVTYKNSERKNLN